MDTVATVRAFNRFYTEHIGVLQAGLLDTPYSLTEARVLFEIGVRDACETGELRRMLGLDAGYLSRILSRFEADGLVTRERSAADARRQVVRLTAAGRKTRDMLDKRSAEQVGRVLAPLTEEDRRRLVAAMGVIQEILGGSRGAEPYVIRPPRRGDLGWVLHRHAVLYHDEYGWDETFEELVLGIVGDYLAGLDDKGQAAWVAEVRGEPVGFVACMREDAETARLRLFFVEPSARNMGIGSRLVEECLRFARLAGYRRIVLSTYSVLADARRVYQRAGFRLAEEQPEHAFGKDLVSQTWSRDL
ncbi:helix-turn-helix domain-containing GNAT family N-acetyltransferase [Thermopolyspora sp. NPDC052614]|uniref:bifunctional helix-turn-helix transcriptional regulator/GNAT family N-acetyltransferase n=1 Tax=Thermopolyspora sp. NPDC052614 TaxID=3155682 RepID=UPI0034345311